jgi:hypothetical protein
LFLWIKNSGGIMENVKKNEFSDNAFFLKEEAVEFLGISMTAFNRIISMIKEKKKDLTLVSFKINDQELFNFGDLKKIKEAIDAEK